MNKNNKDDDSYFIPLFKFKRTIFFKLFKFKKNNIFKIVGQRLTDSLDTVQPYGPNPTNKSFGVIFIPRW